MTEAQRRPIPEGTIFTVKYGCKVRVLDYVNKSKILVEFIDDKALRLFCAKSQLLSGSLRNPNYKGLYDVGFLGVGPFKSKNNGKTTDYYKIWADIFRRCYGDLYPAYSGCSVDERWHDFQEFSKWYTGQQQYQKGWHIDKDLLLKGNKVYGPDVCTMLPAEINTILPIKRKDRGEYPCGVYFCKKVRKLKAQIATHGENQKVLGYFTNVEDAFLVYKREKEDYVKILAEKYKQELDPRAYNALYLWEINIDD